MNVNLYMFGALMLHRVCRHVYGIDIITLDHGRCEKWGMKLTKEVANPRCLSYSIRNPAVFSLGTRTRQRVLAFGGPRQEVTTNKTTVQASSQCQLESCKGYNQAYVPAQESRLHISSKTRICQRPLSRNYKAKNSPKGSHRAWKGDLRMGEEVVTWKLYLGLAFKFSTLERVTIRCCEVDGGGGGGGGEVFGGGVFGGSVVFSGDGVGNGVRGVVCGVSYGVKESISTMIVRVPEKYRWCGTRGKFVRWKEVEWGYGLRICTSPKWVIGKFPSGCNASFITLIPKTQDAKLVKYFRLISLIGSIYKIVTKVMANRITLVISDLVSDVQSAFVAGRQILDGPFILNDLISWYKFGFGLKWRSWIQGYLNSVKGSILVNGSPTFEFKFRNGLKQGNPKREKSNISTLINVVNCFSMASRLKLNLHKSKLMGIGVKVGGIPSRHNFGEEVIDKIYARLSQWKLKTLSIGGRFTLTKAVLSSIPLYQMSMYRVPMGVLNSLWSRFIKAMFGAQGALVDTVSFHWHSNWLDIIREFQSMSRQGLNLLSHAKLKLGDGYLPWKMINLFRSQTNYKLPRCQILSEGLLVEE
uniref:RNA-directed DNA polymerase, eukaryota, reverse transcriptase zinc-binding domain protein n=1 Tax=Tanacetum cinerariifolium TaxID=118510 RepID=A0A6L2J4Y1_TANCI|nr:hypothetical protein [Tanacetum cinerariifolium]